MLPRRHVSRLPPPPPILTPHARTRIIGQARAGYRASKQPAGRRGLGPAGARVCIQTNEKACRPDPFRESADTCGGLTSPFAAPCRSRSGGSRVGKHELGNCEFVRARGGGGVDCGTRRAGTPTPAAMAARVERPARVCQAPPSAELLESVAGSVHVAQPTPWNSPASCIGSSGGFLFEKRQYRSQGLLEKVARET